MYQVVRRARGLNGRWFNMGSCTEHASEEEAVAHARAAAEHACAMSVYGQEIDVRSGGHTIVTLRWSKGAVVSIAWRLESILSVAS